jgi:DNA-binding response OmpR family regulator
VSGGRILVVDDDRDIRDMIEIVLASDGYEVSTAPDGAAALEALEQSRPDLILLDLRMPVLDGVSFLRRYREQPGPHVPVIVLTAAQDVAARGTEIRADGYLDKPFQIGDLLALIGRHLRGA